MPQPGEGAWAFFGDGSRASGSGVFPITSVWFDETPPGIGLFWWNASNPTRMTVPHAGWYLIHGTTNTGSSADHHLQIWVNGVYVMENAESGSGNSGAEVLHVMHLHGGDYIEFYVTANPAIPVGLRANITRLPTPLFVGTGDGTPVPLAPKCDDGGWWDGAHSSRITVDQDGDYLLMYQGVCYLEGVYHQLYKNGTTIIYQGQNVWNELHSALPSGPTFISIHTLQAGDYIEMYGWGASSPGFGSYGPAGIICTTFALARLDDVRHARATQSVGSETVSRPATPVFDTEEMDTNGYHTNGAGVTTISVPSGQAGKYLVFLDMAYRGFTGSIAYIEQTAGGSLANSSYRMSAFNIGATGGNYTHACTPVIGNLSVGATFRGGIYGRSGGGDVTDPLGTTLGLVCLEDFHYKNEFVGGVMRRF